MFHNFVSVVVATGINRVICKTSKRGNVPCDKNADCVNRKDKVVCKCKDGYVGDGFICERE